MPKMLTKDEQEKKALAQGAAVGLVFNKNVRSDVYEVLYASKNEMLSVVPAAYLLAFVDGFTKAAGLFTDLTKDNVALDRVYAGKF
jgi:hypothetical protein